MRDVPWQPPRPTPRKQPQKRLGPSWIENLFAVLTCVMLGTQIVPMFLADGTEAGARPLPVHLTFLGIYFITLVLLLRTPSVFSVLVRRAPLLVLLILAPLITWLWSIDPSTTLQRGVAVVGSSLFGIYLGWRYSLSGMLKVLAAAAGLAAAGSLFMVFFVPSLGLMTTETWVGAWRGLYFHKNTMGVSTALGGVLLVYAARMTRGPGRLLALAGLAVTMVLIAGSRSTSAFVAFVAMLMVMAWSGTVQRKPVSGWLFTLLIVGMLAIAAIPFMSASGFARIMNALGKNAEMSGRLPLWELVQAVVQPRAWLGFGYEAFWNPESAEVRAIAAKLRYTPFYSHNGILETLLNGGIVLLGLVLTVFFITVWRAYLFMRSRPGDVAASFPLVFCLFFIFANFTESRVLARNDLIWSLFVADAFLAARAVALRLRPRLRLAPRQTGGAASPLSSQRVRSEPATPLELRQARARVQRRSHMSRGHDERT